MTCDERRAPQPKPVHLDDLHSYAHAVRADAGWYRLAPDGHLHLDRDQARATCARNAIATIPETGALAVNLWRDPEPAGAAKLCTRPAGC